ADVGTDFRQPDLADARAIRRKDVHAVIAVADPARRSPHIAVLVATDAVREPGLAVPFHVDEGLRSLERRAVDVVDPDDALGFRVVRDAGVGDVEFAIVGTEAEPVRLERLFGDLGDRTAFVDA